MLGRELAAIGLGDQAALGDADQRIMRLVVLAAGKQRLVGRDQRQPLRIGDGEQPRFGGALGRCAVPL